MISVDRNGLHEFYRMSYMWYGAFAVVSCVLIGLVTSAFIQGMLSRNTLLKKIPRKIGVKGIPALSYSNNLLHQLVHSGVTMILENKQKFPRGVYVNEDLTEEWNERLRILRPIYAVAKLSLQTTCKSYSVQGQSSSKWEVGPNNKFSQYYNVHSVSYCFSNRHLAGFIIDNVNYVTSEPKNHAYIAMKNTFA